VAKWENEKRNAESPVWWRLYFGETRKLLTVTKEGEDDEFPERIDAGRGVDGV
jgi:hypothetical protein